MIDQEIKSFSFSLSWTKNFTTLHANLVWFTKAPHEPIYMFCRGRSDTDGYLHATISKLSGSEWGRRTVLTDSLLCCREAGFPWDLADLNHDRIHLLRLRASYCGRNTTDEANQHPMLAPGLVSKYERSEMVSMLLKNSSSFVAWKYCKWHWRLLLTFDFALQRIWFYQLFPFS